MIIYKSGLFYIINNGDHAFRVNDALLNPNEASPLGTRAVINVKLKDYSILFIHFF
jgi:hypothetical protein